MARSYRKRYGGRKRTGHRYDRRVKRRYRKYRGGGLKHLRAALTPKIKESAKRIARHTINRKLGETFLIPSLRPKYSTPKQLIKEEAIHWLKKARANPKKTIKTAWRLLRKKDRKSKSR